ncbi:MAG: oxidoreductase, partial [Myxococcota bacterium]
SVHHFDMLRFLSGGDCDTLVGFGWNPEWSSFKHFSSGMYLMKMSNGVHTFYEGNSSAAGITNCWHNEYYRAEFEEGTVEVWGTSPVKITQKGQESEVYAAPEVTREGHDYLFAEFLDWLDGGPPASTGIQDNIQSFAMVIAAMQTTTEGQPRQISDLIG